MRNRKKEDKDYIITLDDSSKTALIIFLHDQIYMMEQEIIKNRKHILRYEKWIKTLKDTGEWNNGPNPCELIK